MYKTLILTQQVSLPRDIFYTYNFIFRKHQYHKNSKLLQLLFGVTIGFERHDIQLNNTQFIDTQHDIKKYILVGKTVRN
jgi:hypothetical protein